MFIITLAAISATVINPRASIVFPKDNGAIKVVIAAMNTKIALFFNALTNSD